MASTTRAAMTAGWLFPALPLPLFSGAGDASTVPASDVAADALAGKGLWIVEALVDVGLCKSKGDARRVVRQKGVKVYGVVVDEKMRPLTAGDLQDGRIALQVGRKRHHHLVVVG